MTRHYYGFAHKYGRDIVSADDGKPFGYVVVFDTLSDLETWENADFKHRERISSQDAKSYMIGALCSACADYGRETVSDIARYTPMDRIVADYRRLYADYRRLYADWDD